MSRPPGLPPDTQPTPKKVDDPFKDTKPTPSTKRKRNPKPWLWALVLLLFTTVGVFTGVILYQPGLLGLVRVGDQAGTDTAFAEGAAQTAQGFLSTQSALEGTALANQGQQQALQGTAAALNNRENLLGQTATQQALNIITTATAAAISNAQQATQAVLNFQGTQAALVQTATQVQLDFQATQTALIGMMPTPLVTPLSYANMLTLDSGFVTGSETNQWDALPSSPAFALTGENTLLALTPNATLLTAWGDFGIDYTLNAEIIPVPTLIGSGDLYYDVLFGLAEAGYALRLTVRDGAVVGAELHGFDAAAVPAGLTVDSTRTYGSVQGFQIPAERLNVRLQISGGSVMAAINGQNLLSVALPGVQVVGAVGVQVPQGTQIVRLRIV